MKKILYGVAINDLKTSVVRKEGGKTICLEPSYWTWRGMIARCYNEKELNRQPWYKGCSVCDEWLKFSNFKRWSDSQYKESGWEIDKDILMPGNKVYCPDLCIYLSKTLNSFVTERRLEKKCMTGAHFHRASGRFYSRVRNPFTKKVEGLGYFDNEIDAHIAWKRRKHEIALHWCSVIKNKKVRAALSVRYLNYPDKE